MSFKIRKGTAQDAPLVLSLVSELAVYEKLENDVVASADDFRKAIENDHVRILIVDAEDGPCGFALYFFNFSTFLGKRGVYLEDLFVKETHRGAGIGKAFLAELARVAVENNCGRMEWSVLDWNAPSIAFYKSLGAKPMDEWTVFRLTGAALSELAAHGAN